MLQIMQNCEKIRDSNGFTSLASGYVVVNENLVRASNLVHLFYSDAEDEMRKLERFREEKLQDILAEYELDELLDMLNAKCGNGQPLTLNEKQTLRFMMEELRRAM